MVHMMEQLEMGRKKVKTVFWFKWSESMVYKFQSGYTDVASIKETPNPMNQSNEQKDAFRDNHGGALRPGLLKSKAWELK